MSRWFRLYADAMRNPKVARLSDKDFRLWVRLLAVASEFEGHIAPAEDLKHMLSMRLDHLLSGVDRLIRGGLIDPLDDGYKPHSWEKFQYKSDVSTARVVKHREKRNVSETPPDTDTDTDTEKEPPTPKAGGRGSGRTLLPVDWTLPKMADLPPKARACAEHWTQDSYETHGEAFGSYWRSERKMKADWAGTWANRVIALHSQVMRDQKFGNAAPASDDTSGTPRLAVVTDQSAYLAGLDSKPWASATPQPETKPRTGSTGTPRAIGDLVARIAG